MITLSTNAKFDDLERLVDRISRPGSGNTRKIAGAVRQGFRDNFESEGAAAGARWQDLAGKTVLTRRRLGFAGSHPILKRTGNYANSFSNSGHGDHIEEITTSGQGTVIDVGSQLASRIHERGGFINIPARQQSRKNGLMNVGGGRAFVPQRSALRLGERSEQRIIDTVEYIIGQIERSSWR